MNQVPDEVNHAPDTPTPTETYRGGGDAWEDAKNENQIPDILLSWLIHWTMSFTVDADVLTVITESEEGGAE